MDVFTLTDSDYKRLATLVYKKSGIYLGDQKKELVRTRFSKLLREKGLQSFGDYYRLVTRDKSGHELVRMVNAISTNVTGFFREPAHFQFLSSDVLPMLFRIKEAGGPRIWSAGCSTGEEPYTISICLQEYLGTSKDTGSDFSILATDLSTHVLEKATQGIYDDVSLKDVPYEIKKKYFSKGTGKNSGLVRVKPFVMKPVVFRQLNLMKTLSFDKAFDIIFCRNVLIYFTEKDQNRLIREFYDNLNHGGYLFIGHSESLMKFRSDFKYVRPTIYRKA